MTRRRTTLHVRSGLPMWARSAAVWLPVLVAFPIQGTAQVQEAPPAGDTVQAAETVAIGAGPERPSPGGAFLRSVIVPGWGQAASGSYGRAAFYLLAQGGNAWMTYKTQAMLGGAERRLAGYEAVAEAEFLRMGGDPDSVTAVVEADPRVEEARTLAEARSEQKEDWVALLVFFTFLGGADAFVSAHLADFPVPLTVEPATGPTGNAIEIGAAIPWPGRKTAEERARRR